MERGNPMHENRGQDLRVGGLDLGLRRLSIGLGLVFVVALAIIVGRKMSADALAIVVGLVCGVAASIPTAIMLLIISARRDRQRPQPPAAHSSSYPPVVVIQGGAHQALPPGQQPGYWPAPPPSPFSNRQFHVVGGEDLLIDEGRYQIADQ
jgi:hypothetical protein